MSPYRKGVGSGGAAKGRERFGLVPDGVSAIPAWCTAMIPTPAECKIQQQDHGKPCQSQVAITQSGSTRPPEAEPGAECLLPNQRRLVTVLIFSNPSVSYNSR